MANDNVALTSKVVALEMRAQATEELLAQEEFARVVYVREAVEQAMEKFKQSDEHAAILAVERNAGYKLGFKEIFFNIWRKHRIVDYIFLGVELVNLMEGWIE